MIIAGVAYRVFGTTANSYNRHNPICLGFLFTRGGVKDNVRLLLDELNWGLAPRGYKPYKVS